MSCQQRFGRGPWIPKRLIEAWIGALLSNRSPHASLWASTYRETDGIGFSPEPGLILIQCSPAEDRVKGISTRVSRSMLYTYLEDPSLAAWGRHAWFVLVGSGGSDFGSGGGEQASLWAVPPAELAGVVADQGRGTIGSGALARLVEAGVAVGLDALFQNEKMQLRAAVRGSVPLVERPATNHVWAGRQFGLNRPTPLGVALEGCCLLAVNKDS